MAGHRRNTGGTVAAGAVEPAGTGLCDAELRALVTEIAGTLRPEGVAPGIISGTPAQPETIREGLDGLADCIRIARAEIAALGPDEVPGHSLACATGELDEIKLGTERATGEILDQAERVDDYRKFMTPEVSDNIAEAVSAIYQACNFQDLTGQRVSKVITALKHIELRIGRLQQALDGETPAPHESTDLTPCRGPGPRPVGPQMPDMAMSQADVDRLLSGDGP